MESNKDGYVYSEKPTVEELFSKMNLDTEIVRQQHKFINEQIGKERILEVVPGRVYQGLAYTQGYPTVIVTDEADLLVIDCPENCSATTRFIQDLRKLPAIGNKPFRNVIISMFHGDHIWGLQAFTDDPDSKDKPLTVYMHEKCPDESKLFDTFKGLKMPRTARMYGFHLPKPWHLHDGVSHRLKPEPKPAGPYDVKYLCFDNDKEVITRTIAGLEVQFGSAPGYSKDHILTYFPEFKLLHISDLHYYSFPNIYTVRGEPARDTEKWLDDYRKALNWPNVEILIATHINPIYGKEAVQDRIRNAMDAVRFIHDQTLRHMMKGQTADVISTSLVLPREQRERPYNLDLYGCYETAIKAISDFYIGWYSGLAEDLFPLNHKQRADRMFKMIGETKLMEEASKAYAEKDYRWAMELVSIVCQKMSDNRRAKELRTLCMLRLAEESFSVNTRHYLLSLIMEDWGLMPNSISTIASLKTLHMDGVFKNLRAHVDAEKLEAERPGALLLHLKLDSGIWRLELRNSILDTESVTEVPDGLLCLDISEADFRKYLTENIEGGTIGWGTRKDVDRFFSYFDLVDQVAVK